MKDSKSKFSFMNEHCLSCPASLGCISKVVDYFPVSYANDNVCVLTTQHEGWARWGVGNGGAYFGHDIPRDCPGLINKIRRLEKENEEILGKAIKHQTQHRSTRDEQILPDVLSRLGLSCRS